MVVMVRGCGIVGCTMTGWAISGTTGWGGGGGAGAGGGGVSVLALIGFTARLVFLGGGFFGLSIISATAPRPASKPNTISMYPHGFMKPPDSGGGAVGTTGACTTTVVVVVVVVDGLVGSVGRSQ